MTKNRYEYFINPTSETFDVYVLLANETHPAKGQFPISQHTTLEAAKDAIKRYEQGDKRREKQK